MSKNVISVIMAVKNESLYIEQSISSVAKQICPGFDIEIIAVDDNSEDSTYNILLSLTEKYKCLRVFSSNRIGKCAAFNIGVSKSIGKWVCLFAGDDIMPEDSLWERLNFVRDYPDGMGVVGLSKLQTMSDVKKFDGHIVPKAEGRGGFTGSSYLMNRNALMRIFPVPENLPNEDTWMEIAITHFSEIEIVHSGIVGCKWRVHNGNSINMMGSFENYNNKLSPRMKALSLFLAHHESELHQDKIDTLKQKIRCEEFRLKGNIWGILTSQAKWSDRLRSLSVCNSVFYGIRRHLYGFLSGR